MNVQRSVLKVSKRKTIEKGLLKSADFKENPWNFSCKGNMFLNEEDANNRKLQNKF